MQPSDFFPVEIGERAGDAENAVIAARRQRHGFGGGQPTIYLPLLRCSRATGFLEPTEETESTLNN
jgi:hypothetical protein